MYEKARNENGHLHCKKWQIITDLPGIIAVGFPTSVLLCNHHQRIFIFPFPPELLILVLYFRLLLLKIAFFALNKAIYMAKSPFVLFCPRSTLSKLPLSPMESMLFHVGAPSFRKEPTLTPSGKGGFEI